MLDADPLKRGWKKKLWKPPLCPATTVWKFRAEDVVQIFRKMKPGEGGMGGFFRVGGWVVFGVGALLDSGNFFPRADSVGFSVRTFKLETVFAIPRIRKTLRICFSSIVVILLVFARFSFPPPPPGPRPPHLLRGEGNPPSALVPNPADLAFPTNVCENGRRSRWKTPHLMS